MTLVSIRHVPRTPTERAKFTWNHYLDHLMILAVVQKKTGDTLYMPPIWPKFGDAKTLEFHQILHQQMNLVSGSPSSDMLDYDFSKPEGWENFVPPNYRDHLIFHQFVGIPT